MPTLGHKISCSLQNSHRLDQRQIFISQLLIIRNMADFRRLFGRPKTVSQVVSTLALYLTDQSSVLSTLYGPPKPGVIPERKAPEVSPEHLQV